jgi:SAM-dependent methyltransferase
MGSIGICPVLIPWQPFRSSRKQASSGHVEQIFVEIFESNAWQDPESFSGRGSTIARTVAIRGELSPLLRRLGARTLLDAGCGDFNWLASVNLDKIKYLGLDVVPDLIQGNRERYGGRLRQFEVGDITSGRLPQADVVLCRDCFIHLSFADIERALKNFRRSGAKILLATTHRLVRENIDVETGSWRSLNLELSPFFFPEPIEVILENEALGKYLGAWRLRDLVGKPNLQSRELLKEN